MRINDYQIAKGDQALLKETELIVTETQRDKYKIELDVVSDKIDRIRTAISNLPAIPTLSTLKTFLETLKSILLEN